jgi:hypothetical protein
MNEIGSWLWNKVNSILIYPNLQIANEYFKKLFYMYSTLVFSYAKAGYCYPPDSDISSFPKLSVYWCNQD